MSSERKMEVVVRYLSSRNPLIISYSGGLDSTILSLLATLSGKSPCCILFDSPLLPGNVVSDAIERAERLGFGCEVVRLPVLEDPEFLKNPKDRCYICKRMSSGILKDIAASRGYPEIADGVNTSDLDEFRPGIAASDEGGVIHPFVDCHISKGDIRSIARDMGCPFWDEPSGTCLATRVPYGTGITKEILGRIEAAENVLFELGCSTARVRYYGETAKIEVLPDDFQKITCGREEIVRKFKKIGFTHMLLDPEGYRSGSMDEPGKAGDEAYMS